MTAAMASLWLRGGDSEPETEEPRPTTTSEASPSKDSNIVAGTLRHWLVSSPHFKLKVAPVPGSDVKLQDRGLDMQGQGSGVQSPRSGSQAPDVNKDRSGVQGPRSDGQGSDVQGSGSDGPGSSDQGPRPAGGQESDAKRGQGSSGQGPDVQVPPTRSNMSEQPAASASSPADGDGNVERPPLLPTTRGGPSKPNTAKVVTANLAKAKAKVVTALKAKAKAKAKAATAARAKAVTVAGPKSKVQGPAGAKAGAKAGSKAGAKAKAKAKATGCFAGRRPPSNPVMRAQFDELRAVYLASRLDSVEAGEEQARGGRKRMRGRWAPKPKKKINATVTQTMYWNFMQKEMKKLATAGVGGPGRMQQAAAAWNAKVKLEKR